eukprot:4373933-Pleurochrysis_carterae.AAC.1
MDEFINRYPELELKTETRDLSSLTQSRQKVALFKRILKGIHHPRQDAFWPRVQTRTRSSISSAGSLR